MPFFSKASRLKAQMAPMGVGGLKVSSGAIEEEFLNDLQWPDAGKVYQEMSSNDAVVGGCLYLIETMVKRATWHVKPASQESGDIEAAEFLESCMHDMRGQPWDAFLSDVLSMVCYGFSFHEIVYKTRRGPQERDPKFWSRYSDGRIGWQCLPIRSQASLDEWIADENTGVITAFRQDPSTVGLQAPRKDIPIDGNLLFVTKASRGNPEGWSLLRRAYRSWFFKKYIEELEGIGIERGLAGIPVIAPPPSVDLFNKNNEEMVAMLEWAQSLVQDLRQDMNHGVVLPSTEWTLKLMGAEGTGRNSIDTDKIIRRHEYRIASSMLSDLLLIGADASGSFALAETKQSMLATSLQALCGSIAATLNDQAVPTLFALNNWQLERYPEITVDNIKQPTASEVALILRSFKTDFTKNPKLFNFLLDLIQAPNLTEEEYNAFIAAQTEGGGTGSDDDYQDTAENDTKQSDQLTR